MHGCRGAKEVDGRAWGKRREVQERGQMERESEREQLRKSREGRRKWNDTGHCLW